VTTTTEPRRTVGAADVRELRTRALVDTDVALVRSEGTGPRFAGHAAMFDSRTAIGSPQTWGWYESIARGAFAKTLREADVRMLVDHDSRLLVARASAGDLRLREDDHGLAVDADLDEELSYVRDLVRNLEKRRITGMSFGFYVVRDDWTTEEVRDANGDAHEVDVRVIREVKLLEVSAVTFPAYEDTDAGLRAMTDEVRSARGVTKTSPTTDGAHGGHPAPADATQGSAVSASTEVTREAARARSLLQRAGALPTRYVSLKEMK
jgi:HK97 family phage prohead protease